MNNQTPLQGLAALAQDGVEHGSRAIETLQLQVIARPIALIEQLPPLAAPAKLVHAALELAVRSTHRSVRAVNQLVGAGLSRLLARR
jgi:hypothetical protein